MTYKPGSDPRQSRFLGTPKYELGLSNTALLVTDMQYLDAHLEYGMCLRAQKAGEDLSYYANRLKIAISNLQQILEAFRARSMNVIFSKIASLTPDGRDRSLAHKRADLHAPPGSRESMILEEIAPMEGEIVLSKTVSSVFVGTNIHYLLHNIGINTIIVTGVLTSGCVEAAVRDAHDRNYNVVLVEDACADFAREFHEIAVEILRPAAMVVDTDEVVAMINSINRPG